MQTGGMTEFLTLQERLQQVGAELAQLEQAVAANPTPALISMTRSVRDHYEWLEEEILREVGLL